MPYLPTSSDPFYVSVRLSGVSGTQGSTHNQIWTSYPSIFSVPHHFFVFAEL
jgi:hypothetical protein